MGWPDRASQPGLRLRGPEMSRVTGCSTRAARQVRWPSRLCPWFSLRRRGVALHQPRTSRSMLRRQRQRAAREGRARTSRAKPALPMLSKIAASAAQLSALSRSPPPAARRRQMEHRHRARVNPTTTLICQLILVPWYDVLPSVSKLKVLKNGSTLARAPAHQIYRDYVRYIRAYGTGRFSVVS